ncbi:secreted protein [methanotrophic bacterial endosymbiont of Bathymodiolus sp.]|nr:secreted protein [methanotrophic bacterial endosymbiont of Bathymodiolus sp.]
MKQGKRTKKIITSNRRDSSKVKLLNALTLIILLSTQLAIGSQTVTNDEKVANYLTDSFYNLGRAQTDYQEVEVIARKKKKRKSLAAETIRDAALREINLNDAKLLSLRKTSQNWNAKQRIIAIGDAYGATSSTERIARVTWKDLERHASPEDLEDIANHVRIQYLWLRNVIKAYYDQVKNKRYVGMPLADAIVLAKADLKFITKFKKQAEDSRDWIVSNSEGGLWESLCQTSVDRAEEALDYITENLAYLEKVNNDTSPKVMMKNTKAKKDLVNTVMYEAQNEAAYDFLDSIELVRTRMYNQLFKITNVVEDIADKPWVSAYDSFSYNLPCSLEDTLAIAVVIKGYNQTDILEVNDKGVYKDEMSGEGVYPQLLDLCMAITLPNSGVSIKTSGGDGVLKAQRHWWRREITETEEEQMTATIEQLRTLKDDANKPVFLTSSNDEEINAVTKVISRLTELNEITLIAGTLIIDPETKTFKALNMKGEEVYSSP